MEVHKAVENWLSNLTSGMSFYAFLNQAVIKRRT